LTQHRRVATGRQALVLQESRGVRDVSQHSLVLCVGAN